MNIGTPGYPNVGLSEWKFYRCFQLALSTDRKNRFEDYYHEGQYGFLELPEIRKSFHNHLDYNGSQGYLQHSSFYETSRVSFSSK